MRIDLVGTMPPLWRQLEIASDTSLDDLHDIIQIAFGWTDSHLHRFGSGPEYDSHETEYYLSPFEVDEGEAGMPEGEVRLDELLVETSDQLFYLYDFGDTWEHVLTLEAVLRRDGGAPRAVCTGGQRDGPPEDCGGIHGYELMSAAADRTHPDHLDAIGELADLYGAFSPRMVNLTPFDVAGVNGSLARLGLTGARETADLPEPLAELVQSVRRPADRRALLRLIAHAALDEPILVDAEVAATMVRPYSWLLDRVGADGIKLTKAGYLPPVDVEAAMSDLGLRDRWIGKGNREDLTPPVLDLRGSAQAIGLLRMHRGTLVRTPRGRAVRHDPVALWWHLAQRLPPTLARPYERHAGLLLLITMSGSSISDPDQTVAHFLEASGWRLNDGSSLAGWMVPLATKRTEDVVRWLGAFGDDQRVFAISRRATPDGATFARAALRTWPPTR